MPPKSRFRKGKVAVLPLSSSSSPSSLACATSPSSSAPPKACIISLLRFSRSSGVMPIRFIMSSTCGRPSWAAHFRQRPSLTGSPFSFIREINTTATFFLHLEQSVGCIVLLRYRVDFTGVTGLQ